MVKENVTRNASVSPGKGKFLVNFPRAIGEFENAMHKLPLKQILYRTIFQGKGLEFDSYRVFAPNDDASLIDWKASLRANSILAKKYIEERELNVYFLVDVSSSMLFGSGDRLKSEYAAEVVVALSHLIVGSGDKIGLVMFSDDVVKLLYPSRSKNQFALFTKFLGDASLYGGGFDLDKAIDHVLKVVNSPYTIFFLVSDFIHTKKNSDRGLKLMGTRFESVAIMVRDKMDERLPDTKYQFVVQDPFSGKQMVLDPSIAAGRYRENVIKQKLMIKEMLKHARVDLLELPTDKNFAMPVSKFLRTRAAGGRI